MKRGGDAFGAATHGDCRVRQNGTGGEQRGCGRSVGDVQPRAAPGPGGPGAESLEGAAEAFGSERLIGAEEFRTDPSARLVGYVEQPEAAPSAAAELQQRGVADGVTGRPVKLQLRPEGGFGEKRREISRNQGAADAFGEGGKEGEDAAEQRRRKILQRSRGVLYRRVLRPERCQRWRSGRRSSVAVLRDFPLAKKRKAP